MPTPQDKDLSVEQARARVLEPLQAVVAEETLALAEALGRVLAADVVSPLDVPSHDNSAMDGYAFRGDDLGAPGPTSLTVLPFTVLAGHPAEQAVPPGHAVRIMTGAVLPAGLDTVVPLELCQVQSDRLVVPAGAVRAGDHRRRRGEDLAQGQVALTAGRVLDAPSLGLLASLGLSHVPVRRRLRVAVFSTGDELRGPGQALPAGCLYDSNRHSLMAAVTRLGAQVIDLGLVPDQPEALGLALASACAQADVVLTSGGVSVGDADHTRALLAEHGEVMFWRVAMRPGRPFAMGRLTGPVGQPVWLFALPGNPVAAWVSFQVLVRDALWRLAGAQPRALPTLGVRAAQAIRKRAGRSEYLRGWVERGADGHWQVQLAGAQGSGMLTGLVNANALVCLPADRGDVAAGESVEVWLFDGLG